VDDLSSGRLSNVNPGARFFQLDVRSEEAERLILAERPDAINHHAAQISVPASVEDPARDADVNILGLLNVLEAAVRAGVGKVIFISSGGAVYGNVEKYPTPEDAAPAPLSPYAVSKFASEKYLAYYGHQYRLPYTILRYANIYGPRQIPQGEAGVVAIFMANVLSGKGSILYRYPGDEEGMARDYCYVVDAARANLSALHMGHGECVNIGSGRETRTLQLYEAIVEEATSVKRDLVQALCPLKRMPARPGDLPRSCLVVEKARRLLGWRPETPLRAGLRETMRWVLAQQGGS
jgi:UDP-glucose 4-epimerase